MDTRFNSLSLRDTPDRMDLDTPYKVGRDKDGDVIMDDSITSSPSLPLRYHNYFHRIQKVNQRKKVSEVNSLEDMRKRIDEIDMSIKELSEQEMKLKQVPTSLEKIIDPVTVSEPNSSWEDESNSVELQEKLDSNSMSLVRSIMSPTMMGARVAYNSSPASSPLKNGTSTIDDEEILEYSTDGAMMQSSEDGIIRNSTRDATAVVPQQVEFQLHHHHYYYPVNQGSNFSTTEVQPSVKSPIQDNINDQQLLKTESNGDIYLPPASNFHSTRYYISTQLQWALNFVASCYVLYIIYQLVSGMKVDIDLKLKEKIQDLVVEVEKCRQHFEENKCFRDTITPVIRDQCAEWEKCMYKDPFSTSGKLVITLQLVGMIINSLIEPISLRNCFVIVMVICSLFVVNFCFGFLRLKIYYQQSHPFPKHI